MTTEIKVGDKVEVMDAGLAMLRQLGAPTNHHGIVAEIWDDGTILIEFPGEDEDDSHSAPYQPYEVRLRN